MGPAFMDFYIPNAEVRTALEELVKDSNKQTRTAETPQTAPEGRESSV